MTSSPDKECDILIIGAGQVGSGLARQLRFQQPDLKILQIEKKLAFDMWVGEAMTETWEDYYVRILRLGPYLERHTMAKHGLRFMWDSEENDLPVHEMSEFGREHLLSMTARLIDRAQFDKDMVDMNREAGIEVLLGTRVLGRKGDSAIQIDAENGHLVETSAGTIRCKYLIDAAGYGSPLSSALDLNLPPDERHDIGSYWARYENFNNIDDLGPNEWRERINHTQRFLAGTSFMNDGYWIWHIPVTDTVTSLGVVFDHKIAPLKIKNADQMTEFLRKHRCMRDILGDNATAVDFMGLRRLPRRTKKQYSEDRWYLAGISAVFLDPLGAANSWFYPQQNKLIGMLIDADRKGEMDKVRRYIPYFEDFLRNTYEALVSIFGNYDWFGSYDTLMPYLGARISSYFCRTLSGDQTDFKYFLELIDKYGDDRDEVWKRLGHAGHWDAVLKIAFEMRDYLREKGHFKTNNRGAFSPQTFWENRPKVVKRQYKPREYELEVELLRENHEEMMRLYSMRYAELEGVPFNEAAFREVVESDWNKGQSIADIVNALRNKL